ncbi:MAG TPA: SDR family oxidoreductase [Vicinamibacterales bacterium]|nr:SDR family oxidoreductase [Vicinamibacterales bacterium]
MPGISDQHRLCLVTGASSGIGLETARGLATLGATVLMLGRDRRRLDAARDDIAASAPQASLECHVADFRSLRDVRRVANEIRAHHHRLNVLVNNAGVFTRARALTEGGIETQLAVNHLAPFLLTNLLLDTIAAAAPARIVNVASQVESAGRIAFDDLNGDRGYDPRAAYYQSKLANVLFTYELARRVADRGITVNCLHPGVVATQLLNDFSGRPRVFRAVDALRHASTRDGARTSIYLASSPEVEGVTGRYFVDCREQPSSALSRDRDLQQRLWEVSCRLTGLAS